MDRPNAPDTNSPLYEHFIDGKSRVIEIDKRYKKEYRARRMCRDSLDRCEEKAYGGK